MQTHFLEVSNNEQNWGKFLLIRFTQKEWAYKSAITGLSLLREVGWNPQNIIILDLQTGEAARFVPGGCAKSDLDKHKVWVCPMYEPMLHWLYTQDVSDLTKLPRFLNLPDAEFALAGYRRPGPTEVKKMQLELTERQRTVLLAAILNAGQTLHEMNDAFKDNEKPGNIFVGEESVPKVTDDDLDEVERILRQIA